MQLARNCSVENLVLCFRTRNGERLISFLVGAAPLINVEIESGKGGLALLGGGIERGQRAGSEVSSP